MTHSTCSAISTRQDRLGSLQRRRRGLEGKKSKQQYKYYKVLMTSWSSDIIYDDAAAEAQWCEDEYLEVMGFWGLYVNYSFY